MTNYYDSKPTWIHFFWNKDQLKFLKQSQNCLNSQKSFSLTVPSFKVAITNLVTNKELLTTEVSKKFVFGIRNLVLRIFGFLETLLLMQIFFDNKLAINCLVYIIQKNMKVKEAKKHHQLNLLTCHNGWKQSR